MTRNKDLTYIDSYAFGYGLNIHADIISIQLYNVKVFLLLEICPNIFKCIIPMDTN